MENMLNAPLNKHEIETAILRTSKQIHLEAYDVMVKTNRFVHVKSAGGFPILGLLSSILVPVVATDRGYHKGRTENFRGYVLSVYLKRRKDKNRYCAATPVAPCSIMILGRDMYKFCKALQDGDAHMDSFTKTLGMSITIAPAYILLGHSETHKASLDDFFTEKTQMSLLKPFRTYLRGLKNVTIGGKVLPELAMAVKEEMAQDMYTDPKETLDAIVTAKDLGNQFFCEGKRQDAADTWQDTAVEIERMHRGSSWKNLIRKGGRPFVTKIAELYFLLKLNTARVMLMGMKDNSPGSDFLAEDALICANRSLDDNFWKIRPDWEPTDSQMAKLRYRQALWLRLQGEPEGIYNALDCIHEAMHLSPNDSLILQEHETIVKWRDRRF